MLNPERPLTISTSRLELIASTPDLAWAAITNRKRLAELLQAEVPDDWPHALVAPALSHFSYAVTKSGGEAGWWNWHWVLRGERGARTLIGDGGFKGAPRDGAVELGYALATSFHGRGLATEGVAALCIWAMADPRVTRLWAEVERGHAQSMRVLEKNGFHFESVDQDDQWAVYAREIERPSAWA